MATRLIRFVVYDGQGGTKLRWCQTSDRGYKLYLRGDKRESLGFNQLAEN